MCVIAGCFWMSHHFLRNWTDKYCEHKPAKHMEEFCHLYLKNTRKKRRKHLKAIGALLVNEIGFLLTQCLAQDGLIARIVLYPSLMWLPLFLTARTTKFAKFGLNLVAFCPLFAQVSAFLHHTYNNARDHLPSARCMAEIS